MHQGSGEPARAGPADVRVGGFGAQATIDPDRQEWDDGQYEGRRTADMLQARPGWELFRDGCPGGESVEAVGGADAPPAGRACPPGPRGMWPCPRQRCASWAMSIRRGTNRCCASGMTRTTSLRHTKHPWRHEGAYDDIPEADIASPGSLTPSAPAPRRLRGGALCGRRQRLL